MFNPDSALEPINSTYVYVNAFVDELQRAHLSHIVICPGSRSTPLALAFAANPAIRTWMHIDERSAAFFALGMAKRLQQPIALLCTSGTAAANFLPAIVEAHLSHIPLLVLTADRPPELRDCGAPQAIDQQRLYGAHVKWFVEAALPAATNSALRYIRTLAHRVVTTSRAIPVGPVHLNMPFREPLVPVSPPDQPFLLPVTRDLYAWQGRPDQQPYISVAEATNLASPSLATIQQLAALIGSKRRGLIVVGPQTTSNEKAGQAAPLRQGDEAGQAMPLRQGDETKDADNSIIKLVVQLAQHLGYPILADPLSQFRTGSHDRRFVLTVYDAFLRSETFVAQMEPEVMIRFGSQPVSKPFLLYQQRYAHCPQIVIDAQGAWEEPTQLASMMLHVEPVALCRSLLAFLPATAVTDQIWLTTWQRCDLVTREALLTAIQQFPALFEGRVFTELAHLLPSGTLFVGNSMPVRDLDTFFWGCERSMRILGNRGANGIDGVVSTALGVSAVSRPDERTVLVIGDLSFFHDLNGLLAAWFHSLHLTIILVNNNGGGIFSFLPQADYPEHFEQLFGTPLNLDFQLAVQMYGGHFQHVQDWASFRQAIAESFHASGLYVIEVSTERQSNVEMHRQLWLVVEQVLSSELSQWSLHRRGL